MKVNLSEVNNTKILELSGRLDFSNSGKWREVLMANATGDEILLDLKSVDFIDSSGLVVLISFLRKVKDKGGEVFATNLTDKARLVFEVTRATEILKVYRNIDQYMESKEERACGLN